MRNTLTLLMGLISMLSMPAAGEQDLWLDDAFRTSLASVQNWELEQPRLVVTLTDSVEVRPDRTIAFGQGVLNKLKGMEDADLLARFILVHELRHLYQVRHGSQLRGKMAECESDFNAMRVLARQQIGTLPGSISDHYPSIMALQRIPAKVASLSVSDAGDRHLNAKQRFVIGAFASWRSIHEALVKEEVAKPHTADAFLFEQAASFLAPLEQDEKLWIERFCSVLTDAKDADAVTLTSTLDTDKIFTDLNFEGDSLVVTPVIFTSVNKVENNEDRTAHVTSWMLHGSLAKDSPSDYSKYLAAYAGYIDVDVAPKSHVEVPLKYSLGGVDSHGGREFFSWNNSFLNREMIAVTLHGARQAPNNCAAESEAAATADSVLAFVMNAGRVANRQFEGLMGEQRFKSMPGAQVIFYDWSLLPPAVVVEDSYISRHGNNYSGRVSVYEGSDHSSAQKAFQQQAAAILAACEGKGITLEVQDSKGGKRMSVDRLTIFSAATLYLSKDVDDKNAAAPPRYSVTWVVRSME